MSPKELGNGTLLKFSFCNGYNGVDQCLVRGSDPDAVHLKENESRGYAGSLVAVYKWVVSDEMEEVGCCHFKEIGMKILVACSCLWHGESGLQEAEIPDTFGAAVPCYLVVVNLQDLFEAEEEWRQRG